MSESFDVGYNDKLSLQHHRWDGTAGRYSTSIKLKLHSAIDLYGKTHSYVTEHTHTHTFPLKEVCYGSEASNTEIQQS